MTVLARDACQQDSSVVVSLWLWPEVQLTSCVGTAAANEAVAARAVKQVARENFMVIVVQCQAEEGEWREEKGEESSEQHKLSFR